MTLKSAPHKASSRLPMFLQERFLPIWVAFSLGAFADNMLRQALIIGLSFGAIAAPGFLAGDDAVPIIGSFFAIAMIVFSALAGQLADKNETGFMFRRTKLVELFIMLIAGIGFFANSGLLLVIALFAMGAQSAFFSPVRTGAMPKYYAADELIRANALFNAGLYVSILMGLFLGGLLIAQEGGAKTVSFILIAAATAGFLSILKAPQAEPNDPELKVDWNIPKQTVRILAFAFKAPGVGRPMLGLGLFFYISTFVTVLAPFYARDSLDAGEGVATAIMGLFAIGAGIGAIAASTLSKGRSGLGFSTAGVAGAGLMTVLIFLLTPFAHGAGVNNASALLSTPLGLALALGFTLNSALMGVFIAPLQAAVQRRAPSEMRSRIIAANNITNAIAATAGSLSVLVVTRTSLSANDAFLLLAATQIGAALYMWRRRSIAPDGLYDEALKENAAVSKDHDANS